MIIPAGLEHHFDNRGLANVGNYNLNNNDPATITTLSQLFGGAPSDSGERVSANTISQIPAFMGCVSLLARLTAMVECPVYKLDTDNGRTKEYDNIVYELLNCQANPRLNSDQLRQHLITQSIIHGHGLAIITRDELGLPAEIDRIDQTDVLALPIVETVHGIAERIIGWTFRKNAVQPVFVPAEDIIDIPMLSVGGTAGRSFVDQMRQQLGLSVAQQKWGSLYFKLGSHVTKSLKIPGWLTPEQKLQLQQDLHDQYTGTNNAHRMFILQGNTELETYPTNNEQAQWVEGMVQSGVDIATGLNLPGIVVNEKGTASYSSVEQENLAVLRTLEMWFSITESEYNVKLLTSNQRRKRFIEHDRLGSLDPITVENVLEKKVSSTRMSLEEARAAGNQPTNMDGTFLVPSGVQLLSTLLDPPEPPAPVAPVAPPDQPPQAQGDPKLQKIVRGIVTRFKTRLVKAAGQKGFDFSEHRDLLEEQLEGIECRSALDTLGEELQHCLSEQRLEVIEKWNPTIC